MIKAYAAYNQGEELKPFEYDPGELSANQVEIDVHYCGICHSDISMIDNDWGLTQYPIVAGHEVSGKISAIGKDVKSFKIGDNVGLGWHKEYCGNCPSCDSGDNNLCGSAQGTIIANHGGFADKVRAHAKSVVKIPDGVDLDSVGPLFCGGVTVFNPLVQFDIKPYHKVAVIGIGGLGHMALKFLNAWGCEVTAFTSSENKKTEALELGAHRTVDSKNVQEIEKNAGKFDMIISTVNVKLDWNLYLSTLKAKGRLHFVGASLEPLDIGVFNLISAQRSISGSPVGSPETIAKMLDFAKLHKIKPKIEVFKMSEINQAIDKLRNNDVHYRAVLKK
ncbi:MAG: putative zinc-type alcohol dehydrogenase-like protein [Rickettsiales bacterium]|jgi:uncharacterized zinc-type alcohol dehydrogenase-like protein